MPSGLFADADLLAIAVKEGPSARRAAASPHWARFFLPIALACRPVDDEGWLLFAFWDEPDPVHRLAGRVDGEEPACRVGSSSKTMTTPPRAFGAASRIIRRFFVATSFFAPFFKAFICRSRYQQY
jgi:hypothetical protein